MSGPTTPDHPADDLIEGAIEFLRYERRERWATAVADLRSERNQARNELDERMTLPERELSALNEMSKWRRHACDERDRADAVEARAAQLQTAIERMLKVLVNPTRPHWDRIVDAIQETAVLDKLAAAGVFGVPPIPTS